MGIWSGKYYSRKKHSVLDFYDRAQSDLFNEASELFREMQIRVPKVESSDCVLSLSGALASVEL